MGSSAVLPEQVAFPGSAALTAAAAQHRAACPGADYYEDLTRAHRAAGLLLEHTEGGQRHVPLSIATSMLVM